MECGHEKIVKFNKMFLQKFKDFKVEGVTINVCNVILIDKTKNIHIIIGGHTHTFLNKPTIEKNNTGKPVLINQVGWAGVNLGRIDIEIETGCFTAKTLEIK